MDVPADRSGPPVQRLALHHAPLVFAAPGRLFARIEDTTAYGWALAVAVLAMVLMGYIQVQSGLIDRLVDHQIEAELAALEASQAALIEPVELSERMDDIRQNGIFLKTIRRIGAMVIDPIYLLASLLLIASVLYATVALTGRKPEWHTLMSICVHAAWVLLLAYALRLAMVFYYRTLSVDTSLGALGPADGPNLWNALDPFRVWFWVLVGAGLVVTRQLSRRVAVTVCTLLCLLGTGARMGLEFAG